MRMLVANAVLIGSLVIASFLDVRSGRIPNLLTLPAIILGIALSESLTEALSRVIVVAVVMIIGYFVFALGILGGGDVKLAAVIGALRGGRFLLNTLGGALICGTLLAILVLAYHRRLVPLFSRMVRAGLDVIRYGFSTRQVLSEQQNKVPYAIVLAGGALLAFLGERNHLTLLDLVWRS